jgi:hypothetical protein
VFTVGHFLRPALHGPLLDVGDTAGGEDPATHAGHLLARVIKPYKSTFVFFLTFLKNMNLETKFSSLFSSLFSISRTP